jgi:hypothetical protein
MIYSEATWTGYHFAHIAARDEHLRIVRIRNLALAAFNKRY